MVEPVTSYEVLVQEVYEALLRDGDVAIDVGAHRGRHCLPMAECVFPHGKVLAFEPLPPCRVQLKQELAAYRAELAKVLTLYPYALSDTPGTADFVVARDALAYSGLKQRTYDWPTRLRRIPVEVKRLDDLCLGLPSLQFIKIDAEGAEYSILKGATGCLRKFRPVVAFEFGINSSRAYGVTPHEMNELWAQEGYQVLAITGKLLTPEEFMTSACEQRLWDYVAVPEERQDLRRIIVETLTHHVGWHRVSAHLEIAESCVNLGLENRPLANYRGWKRWLIKLVLRFLYRAINPVLEPLRESERALLRSLKALARNMRQAENQTLLQETNGGPRATALATPGQRLSLQQQSLQQCLDRLTAVAANFTKRLAVIEGIIAELKEEVGGDPPMKNAA
jgi:FkbM family methyltransferase